MFSRTAQALLAAGALLAGCGGGSGGDSGGDAFSLSRSSVSFSATQGDPTPAPQTVTITVNRGSVFFATSQTGSGFSHAFQITGQTTGEVIITPSSTFSAGTFTGSVDVRGCSNLTCDGSDVAGSPKSIGVTYTVAGAPTLQSTPSSLDFQTTAGVTPAAKTLVLSRTTGSAAWTSAIAYTSAASGWLSLTPSAFGSLPETITASVTTVPAPGVHTAAINFTAGSLTKIVPVSLTVHALGANFASPYVATASVAGSVIIRGHGFSTLTAASLQVQFGGTSATTASVISDTEIHASHPALAAGTYSITVGDATTTLASRPDLELVVVNAPSFPAATLVRTNNPGGVGNLIYDAERQSIYLMDADRNRIEGYRFNGASWVAAAPFVDVVSGLNPRIALSPDGTEILKTAGVTLRRINPATLAEIGNVSALSFLGGGGSLNFIGFANDGGAIGNASAPSSGISLYRYDMLTQQFAALSTRSDLTNRLVVASADGDKLVLPSFESLIPSFAKPMFTYEASDGSLSETPVLTSSSSHASLSRTGARMIVQLLTTDDTATGMIARVYNGSLGVEGDLPAGFTGFVISPDGGFAYVYFASAGLVRKFNLAVPGFPEVGTAAAIASPGTFSASMAISPDGGTLFLAGNERVIVLPAP